MGLTSGWGLSGPEDQVELLACARNYTIVPLCLGDAEGNRRARMVTIENSP